MTSTVRQQRFASRLRAAGLITLVIGAVGSLGLWFHASRHPPMVIVVLFVVWVLSPFVLLVLGHVMSKRWSALTRATLYRLMMIVTLGSLAIYGYDAWRPRKAQAAFWYVLVPPMSWLLVAIVIVTAALISGRRARRDCVFLSVISAFSASLR